MQEPTTSVTGAPAPPRPPRIKAWLLVLLTLVFSGTGLVSLQWAAHRKIELEYPVPHVTITGFPQGPIRSYENVELVAHATGRNLSYSWDFGDQSTGSGPQVQHFYSQSGTYQVTVTVTDAIGQRSSSSVQVLPALPTADFTYSPIGLFVEFDASQSSADPSTSIQSYNWDFGDGTTESDQAAQTSHTYASSGTYRVTLVIVDGVGQSSQPYSMTISIKVCRRGPLDSSRGGRRPPLALCRGLT